MFILVSVACTWVLMLVVVEEEEASSPSSSTTTNINIPPYQQTHVNTNREDTHIIGLF